MTFVRFMAHVARFTSSMALAAAALAAPGGVPADPSVGLEAHGRIPLAPANATEAADFVAVKADIYYYGWNVLTRGRLSLDEVRLNARSATRIFDDKETASLKRWLDLGKMTAAAPGKEISGDPRLVIDFFEENGRRHTYYSDGRLLLSEDGAAWREIDAGFRRRFTFSVIE